MEKYWCHGPECPEESSAECVAIWNMNTEYIITYNQIECRESVWATISGSLTCSNSCVSDKVKNKREV